MTAVGTGPSTAAGSARATRPGVGRAFAALLWRDVFVTGREFVPFLLQVVLQPVFLLFVFGKVLTELGFTSSTYADVLLPGVVSLAAFLTALQNTAFPLVIDFSFTKEIEDRLLAPLPTALVAVEKIVFATMRALVAALVMFPISWWVLGSLPVTWSDVPLLAAFLVLGSLVGAAMGMVLGTLVKPNRINVVFAVVLTPLLFTGSTQFPWPALESLRWFQVVCAVNPLTYVSEALRAEMAPDVPHVPLGVCALALAGFLVVFGTLGLAGFRRRALD
ncbi:ABC-2 type transport system permease protein [Geodermatophilus dictyosporus]|uniref:Transport permease protein n=1 Tax=Geodermatophilus dictyosporus TaxID=1523247 RepID=A0A1I5MPC4_9ACTN|nr:ABC transporter permease [Geodermatophilus dictyosporus]SFP10781.1 ABC-2 type transport system permease protein [Geodermatophilus dictyosporus]